jgi:RNA polymerase sigma-70 factor, ECF subfamily
MTVNEARSFALRRADEDRAALSRALVAAGCGDQTAFADVYRRTSAKLFGICLRIFADRQEAEDALQDAYMTIWTKAATFDARRASPITWLATVTRNRAIDRLRVRGTPKFAPMEDARDVADAQPLADAALVADGDRQLIAKCLAGLDPRDGAFVSAAFLKGVSYAALAESEGAPLGTVKSRIRRALIKLRACLIACEGDGHVNMF